ncbi:MAG: tetratricopeptide repeat protein [Spirochaetales bacterium]
MIPGEVKLGKREEIRAWYDRLFESFRGALFQMQRELHDLCVQSGVHPTLKYRVKSFESLYNKLQKRRRSGGNGHSAAPGTLLPTDLLGMRIVCPFIEDIRHCEQLVQRNFHVVEREQKGAQYSFHEFGYESIHYLVHPSRAITESYDLDPDFIYEIQLRTILQDAWAEVEHELVYKADFSPFDDPLRRKLAALNANLSLADIVFQEIRDYQRQLNQQLQRRRDSFAEAVEKLVHPDPEGRIYHTSDEERDRTQSNGSTPANETTFKRPSDYQSPPGDLSDAAAQASALPEEIAVSMIPGGETVDNLLLRALNAHNRKSFDEALSLYSRILESEDREAVRATIFMHRGMAHVARGDYASAHGDFESAVALDLDNPKAYYYLALVEQLEGRYEAALEQLNRCIGLDPTRFDALLARSRLHFESGSYEMAMRDCDAALAADPESQRARAWRERLVSFMNL